MRHGQKRYPKQRPVVSAPAAAETGEEAPRLLQVSPASTPRELLGRQAAELAIREQGTAETEAGRSACFDVAGGRRRGRRWR
ncbi:hypothetical protein Cni_G27286 [Canna indica]|uniref:Uncharacterized protein n=1 Tax=Canna indica TaxID=4628 RepID=A0AAQ3L1G9_9LILI|nr:hypothetical protein Cni_G27286 [Canna indica]